MVASTRERRVLVTGANGQLGSEIALELTRRNDLRRAGNPIAVVAATHENFDICRRDVVAQTIRTIEPEVIIHAAAYTAVDACEADRATAFAVNAFGTRNVAEAARSVGAHLLYVSTDYVFDGCSSRPYVEWDLPNPLSVYGASKLGGERELEPGETIVRTSWVCGRTGPNMVKTILRLLDASSGPLRFVDDQHGCPTIAEDLASRIVDLALGRRPGIFHVTNQGATTWFDFARAVVSFAGGDTARVEPISTDRLVPPRPAPRPANSVLENAALVASGLDLLPDWRESTERLVAELR